MINFFLLSTELVSYDDPTLKFMATTQTEAMLAVEVADSEYLLCFRGK